MKGHARWLPWVKLLRRVFAADTLRRLTGSFTRTCILLASFALAAFTPAIAAADQDIWMGSAPFCKASPDDCRQAGMVYVRSDARGDGSTCVSGKKVLCRRVAAAPSIGPLAEQWVGAAPFCQGHAEDCAKLDMDYVRSDPRGNGKTCTSGTKVLCRARFTPCDRRAFLTGHPEPETVTEQAWGKLTDALKGAGIGGSWQHLGTSKITGCVFQIGKNDRVLGDNWRTLDVRVQSVCGVPVPATEKRYIRLEVLPDTRAYATAVHAADNTIISTGGEFGYDHPHTIDGQPLREIRPTTEFSITGKSSTKCE